MKTQLACIGGTAAYRLLELGALDATAVGPRATPFGQSRPIFRCRAGRDEFLFLLRHGGSGHNVAPTSINYRANIYALKDLGAEMIVSWSETRAISHNFRIGQYVLVDDLIDETASRPKTFFEKRGLGYIRAWPVFCPELRRVLASVFTEEECEFVDRGVYVCVDGPRLETPAEARKYGNFGGELIGQTLAPEVFLCKELQLCYAGVGYVARYAENGSNARPFERGRVLEESVQEQRALSAVDGLPAVLALLCAALRESPSECTCASTMQHYVDNGLLGPDWRTWFDGEDLAS